MRAWLKKFFAKSTIRKNLKLMTGKKRGQMLCTLSNESVNGNAGDDRGRPCFSANFWFDNKTGEIKKFTNDTAPDHYKDGQFKVVLFQIKNIKDFYRNPIARKYPEIIETYYSNGASQLAKLTIALSVKLYNQLGEKLVDHRKEK